jgi:hypothetical protein
MPVIDLVPRSPAKARCARCLRVLTQRSSIDHGYGPGCWSKVERAQGKEPKQERAQRVRARRVKWRNYEENGVSQLTLFDLDQVPVDPELA